ncbi:MAG TPA: Ig-like domain-containing protein, partial [Gaiellaceae bacterium]|nr:Ig-like domain-containing protein [Gaiellaceae bacterium]
ANYFGPDSFTYTIQDNGQSGSPPADDFKSDTATVSVTVTPVNDPPDAVDDSKTVAEDSGANSIDVLDNDSEGPTNESSQTLTITGVSTPAHGTAVVDNNGTPGNPADDTITYTPAANYFGPDSFTYTIQDNGQSGSPPADDFKSDTATVSVTVTAVNDAPVVTAGANQTGNENDTISASATFTDVEAGDTHTCSITWGDGPAVSSGTVVEPSGSTPGTCTGSHKYLDDDPSGTPADDYTVTITVTDNGTTNGAPDSKSDSDALTARISNVAPVITGMTGPSGPVAVGGSASVTTNYTDVGTADMHTCEYSWDDGGPNTTVDGSGSGTGSCTDTHTYASAGVYTVGVTVTDDDTGSATSKYEFVVVFDPSAGFVTGGGWINSPAGAYAYGPTLTGRANFGFVSKYKKGANVPEGQTEFQLHFATFNFHSTAYQWLVVSANGTKAQYKGDGKLNGGGSYGFLLTAYDGSPDKFRIKIWDKGTSAIVYDNRAGVSEDIDAADPQAIAGGSIVIHRGK